MPSFAGKDSRWFWLFIGLSAAGHGLIIFHYGPKAPRDQYANRRSEQLISVNIIREKAAPLEVLEPSRKKAPPERPVRRKRIDDRTQVPIEVPHELEPPEVFQVEAMRVEAPRAPAFKSGDHSGPERDDRTRMERIDVAVPKDVIETPAPQIHVDTAKGLLEKAQPLGHVNRKPRYPPRAERQGWEGTVVIRIRVEADGRASHFELKKSSGYRILDEAALKEIRQWHFQPASQDGMKIASWITQPVEFTFND